LLSDFLHYLHSFGLLGHIFGLFGHIFGLLSDFLLYLHSFGFGLHSDFLLYLHSGVLLYLHSFRLLGRSFGLLGRSFGLLGHSCGLLGHSFGLLGRSFRGGLYRALTSSRLGGRLGSGHLKGRELAETKKFRSFSSGAARTRLVTLDIASVRLFTVQCMFTLFMFYQCAAGLR
jgi:hypothetical protein